MDKESIDFIALDEEIESKMRDAKQKRLQDLQEQMKFIVGNDEVQYSRGKWDCCGSESYLSECSCGTSYEC